MTPSLKVSTYFGLHASEVTNRPDASTHEVVGVHLHLRVVQNLERLGLHSAVTIVRAEAVNRPMSSVLPSLELISHRRERTVVRPVKVLVMHVVVAVVEGERRTSTSGSHPLSNLARVKDVGLVVGLPGLCALSGEVRGALCDATDPRVNVGEDHRRHHSIVHPTDQLAVVNHEDRTTAKSARLDDLAVDGNEVTARVVKDMIIVASRGSEKLEESARIRSLSSRLDREVLTLLKKLLNVVRLLGPAVAKLQRSVLHAKY